MLFDHLRTGEWHLSTEVFQRNHKHVMNKILLKGNNYTHISTCYFWYVKYLTSQRFATVNPWNDTGPARDQRLMTSSCGVSASWQTTLANKQLQKWCKTFMMTWTSNKTEKTYKNNLLLMRLFSLSSKNASHFFLKDDFFSLWSPHVHRR